MKIIRYLKWLLNDGRYIILDGQHCSLCGKWYDKKIMIPTYRYNWFSKWGVCDECSQGRYVSILKNPIF